MSKVATAFFRKGSIPAEGPSPNSKGNWVPNTDVFENESRLVIRAEIAGVTRDHLQISTEGNQIRVRGCRADAKRSSSCRFLVMEIDFGCFESVVDVPPEFDLSSAEATFENGLLTIEVPRAPKSRRGATRRSPTCAAIRT